MVEAAIVFPIVLFLSLAFVNLSVVGYASATAKSAATYAARAAAVDPARAVETANRMTAVGIGRYTVDVRCPDGCSLPGGEVEVAMTWSVPNFVGGVARLLGGVGLPSEFGGEAISRARIEAWENP